MWNIDFFSPCHFHSNCVPKLKILGPASRKSRIMMCVLCALRDVQLFLRIYFLRTTFYTKSRTNVNERRRVALPYFVFSGPKEEGASASASAASASRT